MPLLKAEKKELAKQYLEQASSAKNVVVLKQSGIPVNEVNSVRTAVEEAEGKLEVVKKRVFFKGVKDTFEGATLEDLAGSIAVLYSFNDSDQHAPLKQIQKHAKKWKKEKHEFGYDYLGGRYENAWEDAEYVAGLADLPSKEELISKLVYLLNHPMTSLARAFQAIVDKETGDSEEDTQADEGEKKEEKPTEAKEEETKDNADESAGTDEKEEEKKEDKKEEEKEDTSDEKEEEKEDDTKDEKEAEKSEENDDKKEE